MESSSEIENSVTKTLAGYKSMKRNNVATSYATCMAAKMSVDQVDTEAWVFLGAAFVRRTRYECPFRARFAFEKPLFR
jgi:hypothetical protein